MLSFAIEKQALIVDVSPSKKSWTPLMLLFFSVFAATLIAVDINNIQVTRCSFTGRLDSDPDSTVHISGCPNEENMDISLMSDKVFVLVLISNSIIRSF